jgi:ABC-type glycerol-3-phosphate transport system permease component
LNGGSRPLIVLQVPNFYTVALRLGLMSVALVSILPMLVIFVFIQRYFVQGIAGSGMK